MSTLFEITNDMEILYQMLTDPDADQTAVRDTLDGMMGELQQKSAGYVAVINQMDMEQKKAEEMAKFFKEKSDARKNGIKRLKEAIKWAMINLNLTEIEAGNYVIKLQNNGGKLPLQIVGEVPDNFKRIIYEDDTELIRKKLEAGENLGFAYLEDRGKHIVIK